MTAAAISVIVAIIGVLFFGWYRSQQAEKADITKKNDALEKAAEIERQEERAEDEAEASEIVTSGDRERGIGFLRESFKTRN